MYLDNIYPTSPLQLPQLHLHFFLLLLLLHNPLNTISAGHKWEPSHSSAHGQSTMTSRLKKTDLPSISIHPLPNLLS